MNSTSRLASYKYERIVCKVEKEKMPNTIEMLLVAEAHPNYDIDRVDTSATEDEMYDSFKKMREYL